MIKVKKRGFYGYQGQQSMLVKRAPKKKNQNSKKKKKKSKVFSIPKLLEKEN